MFDNVNWNEFINNILSYIEKDWNHLIVKAVVSKISYSAAFWYSENDNDFIDLYDAIEEEKMDIIFDNTITELKKITENLKTNEESIFLTIKVEKTGNVKVVYRNIKESNKLPYDASIEYLEINENDKIMY